MTSNTPDFTEKDISPVGLIPQKLEKKIRFFTRAPYDGNRRQ
jgi:hypothetical protein